VDKIKIIDWSWWPYTFPIRIPGYYYTGTKYPKDALVAIKDTITGEVLCIVTTRAWAKKMKYRPYWPQYESELDEVL